MPGEAVRGRCASTSSSPTAESAGSASRSSGTPGPRRGARLASHAAWWIRNYAPGALRRQSPQTSAGAGSGTAGGASRQRVLSFEEFTEPSSTRNVLGRLVPAGPVEAEVLVVEHDLAEALLRMLHRLPALERRIPEAYDRLAGRSPIALQAIGSRLGCAPERARQIELFALSRVRRPLGGDRGGLR